MKLLTALLTGAALAAVAPAAQACGGCSTQVEAGHWDDRTQRVRVPGRWTVETRNVTTPGRWQVTYQTVRSPGSYKTVNQQVWVAGRWINTSSCTCRGRRRHRRGRVQLGSHLSVSFNTCSSHRRWVAGHYRTVRKQVWVSGCARRQPVRTWIPATTTRKRVRVWKPASYQARTVREWVPDATTTVCNVLG